jgi:DNA polymerase-3 subunit gamma/tau
MTSTSFYRRWRPNSFEEIAGQEHVSSTLKQAVVQNRISHSYLFCGPRGTGKTTTARVLSKAINCINPTEGNPCNNCNICSSINAGKFLDIIELDAASNRGIDEIRSIKEKVNFLPSEGTNKVYIIDEAHMLTDQASNAFLKTLEEPPNHINFILCTTEPQKILPTIISRCQRFDFHKISEPVITSRLEFIAQAEGIVAEATALKLISHSSEGSLRDAENILEQIVVSTNSNINLKSVEDFIGTSNPEQWIDLVSYLFHSDAASCIKAINECMNLGLEAPQIHKNVTELLRNIMLYQLDSSLITNTIYDSSEHLQKLSSIPTKKDLTKYLKIWNDVDFKNDGSSILQLELLAITICSMGPEENNTNTVTTSISNIVSETKKDPPQLNETKIETVANAEEYISDKATNQVPPNQQPLNSQAPPNESLPAKPTTAINADSIEHKWNETIKNLGRQKGVKFNLGALLRDCDKTHLGIENGKMILYFKNRANYERMQAEMSDGLTHNKVNSAFQESFQEELQIELAILDGNANKHGSANPAQSSPLVRVAMGMGAHIVEEKTHE